MEITEKVAYLKGLAEGMELNTEKKEGKLLSAIIDVLEDIALELADVLDAQEELGEGLDAVSEDLADVESCLFDLEDDEDEDEEDEEVYQTTCPNCDEEIFFDEDILADGSVLCPNCGEELEFDLSDLSGCGGCCGACGEDEDDEEDDEDDE